MTLRGLLFLAWFLTGCVQQPYHVKTPVRQERNDALGVDYTLAFVEFDDMGEMYSRNELNKAVDAVKASRSRESIVLIFVHGWKNNASDNNGNVWGFRSELANLANAHRDKNVVGIYIGWRGKFTNFRLVEDFTFWNRFDAATRIPGPALTETVNQIVAAAKTPDAGEPAYVVAIGHSFGGLVLERTVAQAMVPTIIRQAAGLELKREEELFPDLTILLNEAGPAIQAKPLLDTMLAAPRNDLPSNSPERHLIWLDPETGIERPLLVSITSVGDTATRIAFPIGQGASLFRPWFMSSFRKYDAPDEFGATGQWGYWVKTTSNTSALNSHVFETTPPTSDQALYATVAADGKQFNLVRECDWANQTPYWSMQLPTQFVPDHGTVFRPEIIELLDALLFTPKEATFCSWAPTKQNVPLSPSKLPHPNWSVQ